MAKHVKADRDANLIKTVEKDGKQITVNRWNTTGFLISSASSNESGYLSVKVARGPGDGRTRYASTYLTRADGVQSWARLSVAER